MCTSHGELHVVLGTLYLSPVIRYANNLMQWSPVMSYTCACICACMHSFVFACVCAFLYDAHAWILQVRNATNIASNLFAGTCTQQEVANASTQVRLVTVRVATNILGALGWYCCDAALKKRSIMLISMSTTCTLMIFKVTGCCPLRQSFAFMKEDCNQGWVIRTFETSHTD